MQQTNIFLLKKSILIILSLSLLSFSIVNLRAADAETDKYFAANSLYNKKLFKLAAEEYKSFTLKNPNHPKFLHAKLGLALCYFEMKKFREAEVLFEELA